MGSKVKVSFDRSSDVLYAKEEGTQIVTSAESPNDCDVILNYDRKGTVVGTQLCFASELQEDSYKVGMLPLPQHILLAICPHLGIDPTELELTE